MDGSRKVRVLKADGRSESFDTFKLAGAMYRAMRGSRGSFREAQDLASAIEIYLQRGSFQCISSAAVFEMTLKVLRQVGMREAAAAMESHRSRRESCRKRLRLRHEGDRVTMWNKGWVCDLAGRIWNLSPASSRIIATEVENALMDAAVTAVSRSMVIDLLNARVAEFGLADAVPVRQYAVEP